MRKPQASLSQLSDQELLNGVKALASEEHTFTATLLTYLAEVDERRLYLQEGAASLFVFCIENLGFSEDAAYKRTQVARLLPRFPVVLTLVAEGILHLTALNLLAPHLTLENHE